ncbi:MAG: AtpZ/AtpI family protein [Kiloniellaceae bacterium]
MKDDPPLPSLAKLDEKLRAAEAKRRKTKARPEDQGQGLAFALRIGVEIVAALIVGVAIGYFLDRWLGTKPWFLLLFFVLGAAAGFMNVFRVVGGLGGQVGYRKHAGREDETSAQRDKQSGGTPPDGRDG